MNEIWEERASVGILDPPPPPADLAGWFVREYDSLLRFAFFLTGDQSAAEDLVQDAFVRLSEAAGRIGANGFPAYARRTILNLRRSRLRRIVTERRFLFASRAPATPGDPAAQVENRDIHAALMALPVQQRACVALRYYEGFKEREIAELLGISLASVKKHVERGMKRLGELLGGEDEP